MQWIDELIESIDASIDPNAMATSLSNGGVIRDGYDSELDRYRGLLSDGHSWVANYQKKLIDQTGISTLKIKCTNNGGYFIEIPKSQTDKIPDRFQQTQTLTQSQRYTTPELQSFETELLASEEQSIILENTIFLNICNTIVNQINNLYWLSRNIADFDFLQSWAQYSLETGSVTPEIYSEYELHIRGWKHPVLVQTVSDFISNDAHLSESSMSHVITGPNMWGKSTFLRQNALLVLMAHMGYDIPAQEARVWLVDGIFSRVGAGDNIFLGQSTFMVEMQEISYILRHATAQSFLIIDEIGRGTSTYDGMSLAAAILTYNQQSIGAKMLFATHYHEIIDMAEWLAGVENYSVPVTQNEDEMIFLRKIVPGGVKKSYGIEVAKLSGIPEEVISLATQILTDISSSWESQQLAFQLESQQTGNINTTHTTEGSKNNILDTYGLSKIKEIDISHTSPIQALLILEDLQKALKKTK